jgi:hypothetical protein
MNWIPKLTHNDEKRHTWKICTRGRNFQKKVSYVDYSDSKDEDNMVGLAESIKGKKAMSCPFGKEEPERFGFNITKANKMFDLLLQQRASQTLSVPYHTICRAQENEVLHVAQCNVSRHQRLQDLQTVDPISY